MLGHWVPICGILLTILFYYIAHCYMAVKTKTQYIRCVQNENQNTADYFLHILLSYTLSSRRKPSPSYCIHYFASFHRVIFAILLMSA